MPQAHQETRDAIAEVIADRFEATKLEALDFKRAQRYTDAGEAVLQLLYERRILPRLPRT